MTRSYDTIVLGAGAAGLWCAGALAAEGRRVLIIDHADAPARKVRLSGGGKCNVTNINLTWEDYWGENLGFCRSALARFTPAALVRTLEDAGIALEERDHGQMFCRRSAEDVVDMLFMRTRNCDLWLSTKIESLTPSTGKGFTVRTSRGAPSARTVVVALGNAAYPQIGASTLGLEIAHALGHRIVPTRPALAGIVLPESSPLRGLQGISLNAVVRRLPKAGVKGLPSKAALPADNLSLLFTHKGFSGPAGLQTSVYLESGDTLGVDFLPQTPLGPLLDASGKSTVLGLLKRLLPDRLALALIPPDLADKKIAELSRSARELVCQAVHDHREHPVSSDGFRRSEAARGGVDTREVSSRTMQSNLVPGLFFCGEVLDVVGRLGGFNLHWAFASAAAAAGGVAEVTAE